MSWSATTNMIQSLCLLRRSMHNIICRLKHNIICVKVFGTTSVTFKGKPEVKAITSDDSLNKIQ